MKLTHALSVVALVTLLTGCSDSGSQSSDHGHEHGPDGSHETAVEVDGGQDEAGDHAHDEVSLGTADIGEMRVELAQGHGAVTAGKEGHLVVKLPYTDGGTSIVRAWIGSEDRTLSYVGKGTYAKSHDDYDVHAMAPDPLAATAQWWVEVEKPDGTKAVGSADLIRD